MHGQHGARSTNVSLLQIKVKLELDTSDFFRALHKIASTILTAKYKCNQLFSPKTELYLLYCYVLEEFNCACEVCHLVLYITL